MNLPFRTWIIRPFLVTSRIFIRRPFTRMFPHEDKLMPDYISERFRGVHFLDLTKCTGCQACARICPNKCIQMVYREEPLPVEGMPDYEYNEKNKNKRFPAIWIGRCMYCGLCTAEYEGCKYDALHHTNWYGEPFPAYDDLLIMTPELMYRTKSIKEKAKAPPPRFTKERIYFFFKERRFPE